jgi:class 3 adenylate cyclase
LSDQVANPVSGVLDDSAGAADIQAMIDRARDEPTSQAREQALRRAAELSARAGLDRLEAQARHHLGMALRRPGAGQDEDALRELNRALELHVVLGDQRAQVAGLTELGLHSFQCSDLASAVPLLHEAARLCRITGQLPELADVYDILGGVYYTMGDFSSALGYDELELEIATRLSDDRRMVHAFDAMGSTLAALGRHDEAYGHFENARARIEHLDVASNPDYLEAVIVVDWAEALCQAGGGKAALGKSEEGVRLAERIGNRGLLGQALYCLGRAHAAEGHASDAEKALLRAGEMYAGGRNKYYRGKVERELANLYKGIGEPAKALAFLEQALATDAAMRRDAAVHQSAQQTALERIESLRREKDAAERVLLSVLPEAVARRMLSGGGRIAEQVADVSVLFADVVGFTVLAGKLKPADLLAVLDRVFTDFDSLTEAEGLTKIKTIGDAYMVAGGVPDAMPDHLERCARLSLAMLGAVSRMNSANGTSLSLRIGLHVGPAIAGVIGSTRLSYDLWGDTINMASRLESNGVPGRIQVCASVRERLQRSFTFHPRGTVKMKGIGETETFFLERSLV